jgi:hypothetical protein
MRIAVGFATAFDDDNPPREMHVAVGNARLP